MRFTDTEGRDTEDECTLKGKGKTPSLLLSLSLSSISPSQTPPPPLCDDKQSLSPPDEGSQFFSLSSSSLSLWVCVSVQILYVHRHTHTHTQSIHSSYVYNINSWKKITGFVDDRERKTYNIYMILFDQYS